MIRSFIARHKIVFALLLLAVCTSLIVADNKIVVLYGIARMSELILFGIGAKVLLQREGAGALPRLAIVFAFGIIISASIAIAQLLKQASVGGLLYFIGERSFSSETPGIANASINGMLLMRPYASFPHPNVLAWYLLVGTIMCMVALLLRKRDIYPSYVTALFILASLLGSITIFLTLSRSVVVVFITFILLLPLFFFQKVHKKMLLGFYTGILLLVLGLSVLTPFGGRIAPLFHSDKALVERSILHSSAWSMIKEQPVSGVGMHNFLVKLPEYYPESHVILQPVHNIFMLTFVEGGIVGLLLLLYMCIQAGVAARAISNAQLRFCAMFLLGAALLLGLADHYMLTLEQGQILFVFIIALCFGWQNAEKSTKKKSKMA